MSLMRRGAGLRASYDNDADDRYYGGGWGTVTYAGVPMSPDRAVRVSTVNACVDVLSVTLASLPLVLYRRLPNGGKEKALDDPRYAILARRPNSWQTKFEFIEWMVRQLLLRGNSYHEKDVEGRALIPAHPDVVTVEELEGHQLRYRIKRNMQPEKVRLQDEMLHVRDAAEDTITGLSRVTLAREAIAVAAEAERFAGRFLKNDGSGRVMLEHPHVLKEETRKEIRRVHQEASGADNKGKLLIAEGGAKYTTLAGLEQSSFLIDPRKFQVADVCRYFYRVPPFMVGHEDGKTWGTNIAEIKQGLVAFCVRPLGNRIEGALVRDLLGDEQDDLTIEFDYAELLEGDLLKTVQALAIQRQHGLINANEGRAVLKRNPRTDKGGEEYQETPTGASPNALTDSMKRQPGEDDPDDEKAEASATPLLADAAVRIASGDVETVGRRAAKASEDGLKFAGWARGYFVDRRAYVLKVLAPIVAGFGVPEWVAEAAATRIEQTGIRACGPDGVPDGWCQGWAAAVEQILTETFTDAATRRAA